MLKTLAVANYRSLRDVVVPLGRLNVVTGPNGSGKSNLYRALRLLAVAGRGDLVGQLAREGGLPSTLWAGPETIGSAVKAGLHPVQGTVRQHAIGLKLGFASDDFGYCVDLGLPPKLENPAGFELDPVIKRECIWAGPVFRPAKLLIDRRGPALKTTDETGRWQVHPNPLSPFESMMTEYVDLRDAPEMVLVRSRLRSWRFYDHFRSDLEAPARRPQIGTYTPVLADDGSDLAAALQTIRAIGDEAGLDSAIDDAFPGSRIEVESDAARFDLRLHQPGMLRPLAAAELSDGTLRYLLLVAALLSPRPPELLVLNEPETSLHPDLVPALARLVVRAAGTTQIIVVTHDAELISHLDQEGETSHIRLEKRLGETATGGGLLDRPSWAWPPR
jgi:predicted ATPase